MAITVSFCGSNYEKYHQRSNYYLIMKNTTRDGGSTALYAVYTVYTVDTVDLVYTVDIVCTVDIVYSVDKVSIYSCNL